MNAHVTVSLTSSKYDLKKESVKALMFQLNQMLISDPHWAIVRCATVSN